MVRCGVVYTTKEIVRRRNVDCKFVIFVIYECVNIIFGNVNSYITYHLYNGSNYLGDTRTC